MNQDPLAGFPQAQSWSLQLGQAGKAAIFAAIALFLISAVAWLLQSRKPGLSKLGTATFALGSVSLFTAMGCLVTLFARNQFQYQYVFERADVHTDLKYKIAGVWAGQQGSFLLWACSSAVFGLLALRSSGEYRRWFTIVFATFLAALAGILAYETPFNLIKEVVRDGKVFIPPTGNGLMPSLQNYWVVIHPPTIFLGFGALTVMFAYAVAAMASGNVKDWAKQVRPWSLSALAILGLGVCMGGFWAYETLGWGGFWKWDPVENVSFVPWLILAAFVHGLIVQINRGRWHGANLLLGAFPFMAFVYGTFLTRSGWLSDFSVHSFAKMDGSALNILLGFMGATILGFFGLYFARGRKLARAADSPRPLAEGVNRESLYGLGVLLLSLFSITIAIGMSWPVISGLGGRTAGTVDEPVYHKVIGWFFVPIMILVAVAPYASWRNMTGKELFNRTVALLSVSAGLTGLMLIALRLPQWGISDLYGQTIPMFLGFRMSLVIWVAILLLICNFAAVANTWRIVEQVKGSGPVLLGLGTTLVSVGLLWPVLAGLGVEPVAGKVAPWYLLPVMLVAALAPIFAWRALPRSGLLARSAVLLAAGLAVSVGLLLPRTGQAGAEFVRIFAGVQVGLLPVVAIQLFLCTVAVMGNGWRLVEMGKRFTESTGGFVSHFGLAVLMAGLIVSRGFEHSERIFLRPDRPTSALGYTVNYREMTDPNLRSREGKVLFDITAPDGGKFTARPGLFYMPRPEAEDEPFVWPHIQRGVMHDFYFTLGAPIIDVWKEPVTFMPGESKTVNGITVKYLGQKMTGQPGMGGTKIGARLRVEVEGMVHHVMPEMEIGGSPTLPQINDDLRVVMTGMDAATKSVTVRMLFSTPIYPIEVFTKPLTGMVWGGTGILTLGGLIAAYSRRRRKSSYVPPSADPVEEPLVESPKEENAPVPVA